MAERPPTFSAVIPTRNRATLAEASVRRIMALPDAPDQVVVVDDGSSDDTWDRITGLDGATPVLGDGSGPASARNLGAARASGEWLVFLDDDDEVDESWMTTFRRLLEDHPDAGFASVPFIRALTNSASVVAPDDLGPAFGHARANFAAGSFTVRADVFGAVGGFTDGLRSMELTDLALRLFPAVRERGLSLVTGDHPTITIGVRPPSQRTGQDPEVLEHAWQQVCARNRSLFELDRQFHANQLVTIGVAWLRAGDNQRGAARLRQACRVHTTVPHMTRMVVAHVPALRRRVWGQRPETTDR